MVEMKVVKMVDEKVDERVDERVGEMDALKGKRMVA